MFLCIQSEDVSAYIHADSSSLSRTLKQALWYESRPVSDCERAFEALTAVWEHDITGCGLSNIIVHQKTTTDWKLPPSRPEITDLRLWTSTTSDMYDPDGGSVCYRSAAAAGTGSD